MNITYPLIDEMINIFNVVTVKLEKCDYVRYEKSFLGKKEKFL